MNTRVKSASKKILILDDEASIQEALQMVLNTRTHYTVETATSFTEIAREGTTLPDLILLDMRLGGKDGKEVARKLKGAANTKNIPLVMMSGYPESEQSCRDAGADDYLEKPFSIKELLTSVKKYLG